MDFDEPTKRFGTHSSKWDGMQKAYGFAPNEGLGMWIADMDFRAPEFLQDRVRVLLDRANYGYFTDRNRFADATAWWMDRRHDWKIDPDWCLTTGGLGNGIAMGIQAFTEPKDKIAIFTPVYHEFTLKIRNAGRRVVELPLTVVDGVFRMDFDAYQSMLDGTEKMMLFCSPHNPAGRVWSAQEITELCEFCARNDLILVADEIHHDLVYPGNEHIVTHKIAKNIIEKVMIATSASKTFNIAGSRTGCVMFPDPEMRTTYAKTVTALNYEPNLFGVELSCAAYSHAGAQWLDQLIPYLHENQRVFSTGLNAIPGIDVMPMQGTYLSLVDFAGTGMDYSEIERRVIDIAKIAPTPGPPLGRGGELTMRFNIATQRSVIVEAVTRMQKTFADLQ